MTKYTLAEDIEAVEIDEAGTPVAAMIDFVAGDEIMIERQTAPGIFGWEHPNVANEIANGRCADVQTVFTAMRGEWAGDPTGPYRYTTLNLPAIPTLAPEETP